MKINESKTIVGEKAGKLLEAVYFETANGSGVKCYISGKLVEEKRFEGKDMQWAQAVAHGWLSDIKPLNG